ncbi:MAG: helix-turn-helix transcriptional regulator [Lachnospiraceae bacterium]|nr:helix-turn-helix transcriptional regulator [Lachnospiraceae bacterium]
MDRAKEIKELRALTGMNRREFCDYFGIPYRTVTEWERDNRHAPEYVIKLLEYYINVEIVSKRDGTNPYVNKFMESCIEKNK